MNPETFGGSFDAGGVFNEHTPRITHRFRLSHRSSRAVNIKAVNRSCSCTTASVSKESIAPGEVIELTMTVDVKPVFTDQVVHCTLKTDHPDQPDWTYRLSFRTYPRIRFDTYTVDLGMVSGLNAGFRGEAVKVGWLEVFEPATPITPPAASIDLDFRPPLHASVEREPEIELIEGGAIRRTRFLVRIALDRASGREEPSGTFTDTLVARSGRGPVASTVVSWSRLATLEAAPSNLSFGLLNRTGDRSTKRVVVRSRDNHPFRILSVDVGTGDVSVGNTEEGANPGQATTQVVELIYHRGTESRRFATGQALIRTDHPEMPSLRVSWSAITP